MNRKVVFSVLVLVALVAVYWFLRGGGTPIDVGPRGGGPAPVVEGAAGDGALADLSLAGLAAEAERRALDGAAVESSGAGAATQSIEGRILLPAGLPADERAVVMALRTPHSLRNLVGKDRIAAAAFEGPRGALATGDGVVLSTCDVGADGRFRLEVPAEVERAHLAVSGRYLYSHATTAVALADTGPVVLVPELGAWLTGRTSAPADVAVEGVDLVLTPDLFAGIDALRIEGLGMERLARSDADGSFEFRALPGVGGFELACKPESFAALHHRGIDLRPGAHVTLDVALERGASLAGHALGADGHPVEGATVRVRWRGRRADAVGTLRETQSDATGAFVLEHVPPGRLELVATAPRLAETRLALDFEVEDGQEVVDLVLHFAAGASITGRVVFTDGAPAAGAALEATADLGQLGGSMTGLQLAKVRGGKTTAKSDGTFEITGVTSNTFVVSATHDGDDSGHGGNHAAKQSGVAAGSAPVELVLAPLAALRGVVVARADGAPIDDFTVDAVKQGSGTMLDIGAERRNKVVTATADGSFELAALEPGVWSVRIAARGFAASEPVEIEVEDSVASEPTRFELDTAAQIAGRVVDPAGVAVIGARVILALDVKERVAAQFRGGIPEVFTGEDGEFLFTDLAAGTIDLRASAQGFAASPTLPCEVGVGLVTSDVVLQLRRGGTLTGVVYGNDGAPAEGRLVIVQPVPDQTSQYLLKSDARGEFRLEHLEPGAWQVIATTDFLESAGDEGGDTTAAMLSGMKMASVQIEDGGETHVVLGEPPPDPVDLTCRVTHAGAPVEGVLVSLVPKGTKGKAVVGAMKIEFTDKDGRFATRLDASGDYLFTATVVGAVGAQNSVEFQVRIPSGSASHTCELELPGGSISGRVRGPDGEPLADCRITANVDDGVAYGSFVGGGFVEATTDADGRYHLTYLRAGSYSVAAGGLPLGGMLGGTSKGGRVVRGQVALSDGQCLENIDFQLEAPAVLRGIVRDGSGAAVSGAGVFVRAIDGSLLERFSGISTDAGGRFQYAGLAPGDYVVSARRGELASAESAPVHVDADGAGDVELMLLPGTVLLVTVVDGDDALVDARVTVRDARGHNVSGMLVLTEMMELLEAGLSDSEQRVGPLPVGDYTVTAVHVDGRTKSRKVKVTGGGEKGVRLKLD